MADQTIIYKEYAVRGGDYKNATDNELSFAQRSGDAYAGAERLRRIREGDSDLERMERAESAAQNMILKMEGELSEINRTLNV